MLSVKIELTAPSLAVSLWPMTARVVHLHLTIVSCLLTVRLQILL